MVYVFVSLADHDVMLDWVFRVVHVVPLVEPSRVHALGACAVVLVAVMAYVVMGTLRGDGYCKVMHAGGEAVTFEVKMLPMVDQLVADAVLSRPSGLAYEYVDESLIVIGVTLEFNVVVLMLLNT